MKKIFIILFLLFTNASYAGVNEIGSGMTNNIKLEKDYKKYLKKSQDKKKNFIYYVSIGNGGGFADGPVFSKEINDASHEKAYKRCMKNAKKSTQNDCFLYAINDTVVWDTTKTAKLKPLDIDKFTLTQNYSDGEVERRIEKKLILSYKDSPELNYIKEEDNKAGRSLVDRPDVNDDFQIHFIYLLDKNMKDKEWDINGFIEKRVIKDNNKLLEITAKNKKSNGVGQKFKYDFTKDGKLDVSFVRMNFSQKDVGHDRGGDGNTAQGFYDYVYNLGFNNPKKLYFILAGFKSLIKDQGGEGGPAYAILYMNYCLNDKQGCSIIHEAFHSNGAVYGCGKNAKKNDAHMKNRSDIMGSNSNGYKIDAKNNSYYRHSIEGCPDLANSVYLTPTSENSWDPYDVFCRANYKNFTHKKAFVFPRARNGRMCKIKKLSLIQ